jgi:hypothetical protein
MTSPTGDDARRDTRRNRLTHAGLLHALEHDVEAQLEPVAGDPESLLRAGDPGGICDAGAALDRLTLPPATTPTRPPAGRSSVS